MPGRFYLLAMLGLVTTDAPAQSNRFWQAQSIDQIFTDRFYDRDTNNDNMEGAYASGNPSGLHSGDFKGIERMRDDVTPLSDRHLAFTD